MAIELAPDALDFSTLLRPGDRLAWGQASAEPTTLTARLFSQCVDIPALSAFVGMSWGTPFEGAEAMRFQSYCGAGHNRELERQGRLDILPCHYSELPGLLAPQVDVLLLSLADDGNGRLSFGAALEYLAPLVDRARLVIAEVGDQTPWTFGERTLSAGDVDIIVRTSRKPSAAPAAPPPLPPPGRAPRNAPSRPMSPAWWRMEPHCRWESADCRKRSSPPSPATGIWDCTPGLHRRASRPWSRRARSPMHARASMPESRSRGWSPAARG